MQISRAADIPLMPPSSHDWSSLQAIEGGKYRLKRDLFLADIHLYQSKADLELLPPWAEPRAKRYSHFSEWDRKIGNVEVQPSSIAQYRSDPLGWPHIHGVAPAGTRITLTRVERVQTFATHWDEYWALFVDGPFAGERFSLNNIWLDSEEYLELLTVK
jgi:hypothetical protein